jgi:hypothetical protein
VSPGSPSGSNRPDGYRGRLKYRDLHRLLPIGLAEARSPSGPLLRRACYRRTTGSTVAYGFGGRRLKGRGLLADRIS